MKHAASVFRTPRPFALLSWYAVCIASGMLNMLTAPALTLVFMGVVASLGTAFVWMFWEIEQVTSRPSRNRGGRRG